jgi:ABC-type branched-subunit amino acid transport system substrate-binding protein
MRRLSAAALLLLISCTEQVLPPDSGPAPTPGATQQTEPPARATLRLVADDDPSHAAYVEGMRFAVEEVNARGDLSLELLQGPSVEGSLGLDPAAVIVVGDPTAVAEARPAIEEAGVPVVLVGGDLYSSRELFRYAFQTSIPYRWQALVIARYLVADRRYQRIVGVAEASSGSAALNAITEGLAEEGSASVATFEVRPPSSGSYDARSITGPVVRDIAELAADAVLFLGATPLAAALSHQLSALPEPPQLALSAQALDVSFVARNRGRPGTVAGYTYAWSGWADMLPRVHSFRERFAAAMDHYPASLEQEGYDAVMAVAEALSRTGGAGGDRLVQELETFRDETYSSVPVRLGPDDHVFAEQSHLGLFAIEEPVDAALPPGEASSLLPWRPILRTFTTDGEKVNFLDRDKRIFFPFWRPKHPTPKYWRSEYGIVSRPSDRLH